MRSLRQKYAPLNDPRRAAPRARRDAMTKRLVYLCDWLPPDFGTVGQYAVLFARQWAVATDVGGYSVKFIYRIYGRELRGSLYPPRVVLHRVGQAIYRNEGHSHRVSVAGAVLPLAAPIYHDDRKPLAHWIASQQRYARQEADYLLSCDRSVLSKSDRVRLAAWAAPLLIAAYTLIIKGCLFDGWRGWFYTLRRMLAETLLALEIIDRRLRGGN